MKAVAPTPTAPASPPPPRPRRRPDPHLHLGELGGGPAGHFGHAKLRQLHLQIVQLLQQLLLLLPPQVSGLDLGLQAGDRPSAPLPVPRRDPGPTAAFPKPPPRGLPPPALIPLFPALPPSRRRRGQAGSVWQRRGGLCATAGRPVAGAPARMPPDYAGGRQGSAHHDGSGGAERTEAAQGREAEGAAGRSLPIRGGAGGGACAAAHPPRAARWYRPRALTGKAAGQRRRPRGTGPSGGGCCAPLCRGGSVLLLPPALPQPPDPCQSRAGVLALAEVRHSYPGSGGGRDSGPGGSGHRGGAGQGQGQGKDRARRWPGGRQGGSGSGRVRGGGTGLPARWRRLPPYPGSRAVPHRPRAGGRGAAD